jgi:hypothetical protein
VDPITIAIYALFMGAALGSPAFARWVNARWPNQSDEHWARLARERGLLRWGDRAYGFIDGVPVLAEHEARLSLHKKSDDIYTVVKAQVLPHLDLGLSVCVKSAGLRVQEQLGLRAPDVLTGHAEFDEAFYVGGWEPERVRALVSPEIRQGLATIGRRGSLRIEDGFVHLEHHGPIDPSFTSWCLDTAVWAVQALQRAAPSVPPSPLTVPYLPAYDQAARVLGLGWRATPAALGGLLDGVQVWAQLTRRNATTLGCDLYAAYPQPFGLGLGLRSRRGGSALLLSSPEIELGEPSFDERFDVHARDAEAARAVFDADLRARISYLADRGGLSADDFGARLVMEGAPDPRDVVPTLRLLRDLAAELSRRGQGRAQGARGAYR